MCVLELKEGILVGGRVLVLIRFWQVIYCYSCDGRYRLQNTKKLLLGGKKDGMFIWEKKLAELLGFQRSSCVQQKLSMFHMAAVLSFTVTTEFC